MQEQVGVYLVTEAGNGRGVKGDTIFKRAVKLVRMDGDILLLSGQVAECQTDELHVLLRHILLDLVL